MDMAIFAARNEESSTQTCDSASATEKEPREPPVSASCIVGITGVPCHLDKDLVKSSSSDNSLFTKREGRTGLGYKPLSH